MVSIPHTVTSTVMVCLVITTLNLQVGPTERSWEAVAVVHGGLPRFRQGSLNAASLQATQLPLA